MNLFAFAMKSSRRKEEDKEEKKLRISTELFDGIRADAP